MHCEFAMLYYHFPKPNNSLSCHRNNFTYYLEVKRHETIFIHIISCGIFYIAVLFRYKNYGD